MSFGDIWMNWISLFLVDLVALCLMILMATVTGSITFCLWKCGSRFLEEQEKIQGIRVGLFVTVLSFLVPFLFFYKAFQLRFFWEGNTGPLFWNTPVLMFVGKILFLAWTVGAIRQIGKRHQEIKPLRKVLRNRILAGGEIQKTADRIRAKLHIRKKISVYFTEAEIGPMIAYVWKSCIFLPERVYEEKDLEVILEHELRHYRQGDLILKKLCGQIAWIHWFNPLVKDLWEEINRWGEISCDRKICYGCASPRDRKQYFLTILEHTPEREAEFPSGIGLGRTAEEIKRRMEKMRHYDPKKEWNKAVMALLILCFVLTSALTSLAAGEVIEELYKVVYDATEVIEYEELQPQPEVSDEYEWVPGDDITIIESEENPNAKGLSTYTWTLPVNSLEKSGKFYAVKGSKVTISVTPDPTGSSTGIGLDQPTGNLRGVSGSGTYDHTFTINESGNYKVYARNEDSKQIDVVVIINR